MHGSETWPMKVEHDLKLNHTEMSMIRWICGVKLNESSGGASYRAKGLKPPPQFLLQPLQNSCVK